MAAPSCRPRRHQHHLQHIFLNHLAPEVLAIIFDYVRELSLKEIISVRLACRRFNELATPIEYRRLVLDGDLLRYRAFTPYNSAAFANMALYTNHLVCAVEGHDNCVENHRAIAEFTRGILRLDSFTWRYAQPGASSSRFSSLSRPSPYPSPSPSPPRSRACICPISTALLDRHGRPRSETRVYIENVAPRQVEKHQDSYLAAIPTSQLVSLKMAAPIPPLMTGLDGLKKILLRSRRTLEVLHYQDKGRGTSLNFQPDDRLPPLRELRLECYDWTHSADEVRQHWDFSRIRHLELIDMPVLRALSSIIQQQPNPNQANHLPLLAGLQTLSARDFGSDSASRPDLSALLEHLVRHRIRALRNLRLTVDSRFFAPDCLLRHAATLETLSLRDFVGFGDENKPCPTMWVGHLSMLARGMSRLHTLELDMDIGGVSSSEDTNDDDDDDNDPADGFLRVLCRFPRLRTLTLHVQTVVRPTANLDDLDDLDDVDLEGYGADADSYAEPTATTTGVSRIGVPREVSREVDRDLDRDAALDMLRLLVREKAAAAVAASASAELSGERETSEKAVAPAWKSITINVGGWRRAMVRRLSPAWKRLNERGLFAERCFVMEERGSSGHEEEVVVGVGGSGSGGAEGGGDPYQVREVASEVERRQAAPWLLPTHWRAISDQDLFLQHLSSEAQRQQQEREEQQLQQQQQIGWSGSAAAGY